MSDRPTGNEPTAAILHIDLSRDDAPILATHTLHWLIFWWKDRPVGQGEAPAVPGETLDIARLRQTLIDPACLREAQSRDGTQQDASGLTATVVICTRDRPDQLARCLQSLPDQSRPPDQIIVVDNRSQDERTREVALAHAVRYIREDRPGLDIARNTGAMAASSQIIAYTDDDVVLHRLWLERTIAAFDDKVDAVTGLVLPGALDTPAQLHFERHWGFGKGFCRKDFDFAFYARDKLDGCPAWEVGAGASMAFRKSVFTEIGLFDERLDVGAAGCSGDSEFWHRLLSHGRQCRYDPAIVAFHYHRRDEAGLRAQIRAYMRGHAAALLVQYERTGNAGNLRRLFRLMPRWFARRALLERRKQPSNAFLRAEIAGYLAGIVFYAKGRMSAHRRSDKPPAEELSR